MKNLNLRNMITLMFLGLGTFVFGQLEMSQVSTNPAANKPYYMYIFPADSLQGFDQNACNQQALAKSCFGMEYHVYNYMEKRRFINEKYGLNPFNYSGPNINAKPIISPTNQVNAAPCVNEDFEASPATALSTAAAAINNALTGWQVNSGNTTASPYNNCTMANCCGNAGCTFAWVRQTPYVAPAPSLLGTINASPFGGTKVLQLSDNLAGGKAVRVQQTFPVTSSNALFQVAFRAAMLSGHACCENPFIKITVLNCSNQVLACPKIDVQPPGPSCASVVPTGWQTNSSTWVSYTPNWIIRSIDLTPYINSCVTIRIEVGDCPYAGHWGMAYVDCQCLPQNVTVNNINFPAGSPIVAVAACGVTTATMVAPVGLGPYSWTGPPASAITNNPNQTITTTVPGNYTLTMNPPGSCAPITKTVNLQFGQFPNSGFTVGNTCTTYTITNTGSPAPSIQSYSFTGPGAPVSYTTTNNTSVVNFAPNTTYTIWQTVTNPQNCPKTFSMVITTPNGPNPAFTASPSFTLCQGQNPTFSAVTSAGSHTYAFTSYTTVPATGFNDPYGPVVFPAVGTFTVTHTLNTAGCIVSTSSVLTINPPPSATATAVPPQCAGSTATLNGVGGPGVLSWSGPNGFFSNGPLATIPNFQAVNTGIYTLTVNNFGCITTKTVQLTAPNGPTVNVTNNGPVCVGSPLVLSATYTSNSVPSYFYWYTYVPTPYFYHYGGYNVAQPTIAVTTTANTQNYVFYISFGNGCPVQTYTTSVQMVSLANPTVSNTGPYCPGATIQLNANVATATTYTWSGPASFSSTLQNPTKPNAQITNSGVYTLTTAIGNCKKTAQTTVSVHPVPTAVGNSNSPVCLGQNINLTSNAAASYTWTGPNAFASNLQNPTLANSTLPMAGTYTLKITTAQGCTAQTTVTVAVLNPTTSASNTGPYCAGSTIQLNAVAATSYSWSGPNFFTSNAQNPTIANSSTLASGNYTLLVSIGTCTASSTTSVTVNALPTPTATNTGPYCLNQNIQLLVNAFNTYTWSGPSNFTSNNQNPAISTSSLVNAGPYVVTVTDANGCVNTSTTNVVVNPLPVVAVNNPTACLNDNILLTANGGTAYAWAGPNGFNSAVQNPTITNATTVMSGNYTVTVTSGFGCVNTGVASASVIPLPTVSVAGTQTMCSQNLNGSINSVLINGNGANSYVWSLPANFVGSPSLTNPSFTLFPPLTVVQAVAQLSVVGTGAYGCTNTAVYDVTVVPNPTIVPAPATTSVCQGVSANLSVSGASTYTWAPSASLNTNIGSAVISNATVTTVYNIIGTDQGCNSATESATVLVVPNPTVILSPGVPTLCIGQSINLTAAGASSYTWFPGTALSTTVGSAVVANPSVTLTYSVLGEQSTCTNVAAITVTVNQLPTIIVTASSPTMCMNSFNGSPNSITFTASGASTYTWGGFSGMSSNSTNGNTMIGTSILQSATASGTVLGFDGSCYNVASFNVAGIPNPIIAATSASMCEGTSVMISASGATNYTWSPAANLSSSTGASVTASPNTTSVFNVFGNVGGCNSSTESSTVTVVQNPILMISPVTPTICEGASIGLTAFGAVDYTWTPSNTLSSPNGNFVIASPLTTTNYTLIGSAATCTSQMVRQVKVTPLPNLFVTATKTVLCIGDKVTINANGSSTYTWLPLANFSDPYANQVTISPTLTSNYYLIGNNGPCTTTLTVPIEVLKMPVLQLSTSLQKICHGNNTSIVASGALSYTWAPEVNMTHVNQNVAVVTPSASTNYTVMGINQIGTVTCMMTKEIMIEVVPQVTAAVNYSVAVCQGESVKLQAGGSDTYVWAPSTGLSNTTIANPYASPVQTTTYTVFVSNGGYCGSSATVLVKVNPQPTVDAGPDMRFNIDEPMYLNARGTGTLTWIMGDGILCKDCPDSQIMPTSSGCYKIQAVTAAGCKAIDEVCIEVTNDFAIYIPNIFTPNYDGLNDVFLVYGTGITKLEMNIFDRWGEKLFTSNDQKKGWDGTSKGLECKDDVYTYLVNYTTMDGKKHTKTGHVTILK